jgi:hypothetical protein
MILDGVSPRLLTMVTRERVNGALTRKCTGWHCEGDTARFTRRLVGANWTIHIQCLGCGRSLAGALRRDDVQDWRQLPLWDDTIREEFDNKSTSTALITIEEQREAREREAAVRRSEYSRWLLTSPEWRTLRDRVVRRSLGNCEACLASRASDVHHLTYRLGRLPPAWELRAVCRECHDRLHNWIGGE